MMPKIVFFGDNVNRQLVEDLYEKVKESDAVLVLGSSLQVSTQNLPLLQSSRCPSYSAVHLLLSVLLRIGFPSYSSEGYPHTAQ